MCNRHTRMVSKNGQSSCLLNEEQCARVKAGMLLRENGESGEIVQIPMKPMSFEELRFTLGEYALYAAGIAEGEWRYEGRIWWIKSRYKP